MRPTRFGDPPRTPATDFTEARVGGLSVGVPGTVARLGDRAQALRHALAHVAAAGPASGSRARASASTQTFNQQVTDNEAIFDDFPASRGPLPDAARTAKPVGDVQRNPDLAATYERIGARPRPLLPAARIARDIAQTVQHPPLGAGSDRPHRCTRAR